MTEIVRTPIRRQGLVHRIIFDSIKCRFRGDEDFERSRRDVARDVRDLIAARLHAGRYAAALDRHGSDERTYFVALNIPKRARLPIKIGRSRAIAGRVGTIQTTCPFPVALLVDVPHVLFNELTVHAEFNREHLRGEWFLGGARLLRFIDDLRAFNTRQGTLT